MNLELLKGLEEFGKKNFMFNVHADVGRFLYLLVKLGYRKVLEVGMSNGYSALWMAFAGGKVRSIERDKEKIKLAEENFRKGGVNVEILEGDAKEILKDIKGEFDLVLIDATKKEYIEYVKLLEGRFKVLVADNTISHKGKVKDYLEYVRKNYDSFELDIGAGAEVSLNIS